VSNVADNGRWRVERVGSASGDRIEVVNADGSRRLINSVSPPAQLGRPALDGDRLVFHQAGRFSSKVLEVNLATGVRATLRSTRRGVLLNPSLSGERLLYVHSTFERQKLKLGARTAKQNGEHDKVVFSMVPTARRDKGYEDGHRRHKEGYKNHYGKHLPARPEPGVVETLWEPTFAAGGAIVTRLHQRPDGGVDAAVLNVKL
jgi:hypothetical protein